MPKVTTAYAGKDDLRFKYDIAVDKEGAFTTTLPVDVVQKLQAANISLNQNRLRNLGFFRDSTLDGLKKQIGCIVEEYFSRKLISEKIVIRYFVKTSCSYCLSPDGDPVPNGSQDWTGSEDYNWKTGTVDHNAYKPNAYGIEVYAKPCVREDYTYKSGIKKTEYNSISRNVTFSDVKETNYYLRWLDDLVAMVKPDGMQDTDTHEIDYTEQTAAFFVNLISSICKLNEKIKDQLDPKSILKLISQKQHLLGGPA